MSVLLFEDGWVQLVWVLEHTVALCTLSLVVTRSLWSLCDFFWISLIIINIQIPFVWGEPASECIVGVLCCGPCACHSCWWRLSKRWCFGWISHFFDSKAFENHMDCIKLTNSWIVSKSFCLRTVQCSLYDCWCTSGLVVPCFWWSWGHFDRFVIFSGFILSILMLRSYLFGGQACVSP